MHAHKLVALATMAMLLVVSVHSVSAEGLGRFPTSGTHPQGDCLTQYGVPPQAEKGHPTVYLETGTEGEFHNLCLYVRSEFTLILGGVEVNGVTDGAYIALNVEHDMYIVIPYVQNGFVLLTRDEWAQDEFQFRLGETGTYRWARGHVFVPESWMNEFRDYNPVALTDL